MKKKIGIINYKTGNVGSLYKTLKKINENVIIINKPSDVDLCHKIFLPGVGSYQTAMQSLKLSKIDKKIKTFFNSGNYIFAICLGMQILFEKSNENIECKGINLLPGKVSKILTKKSPLPHIGWSKVYSKGKSKFDKNLNDKFFYFCHSYICKIKDGKINKTIFKYDNEKFISSVNVENLYATQFHPELSGENGMNLFRWFLNE